jgi:hypothetical protein
VLRTLSLDSVDKQLTVDEQLTVDYTSNQTSRIFAS